MTGRLTAATNGIRKFRRPWPTPRSPVLLISPDFLASGFITKEEVPYLIERQEKHGMLLIPVLVRKCPWKAHRWLADRQMVPRDGKCVAIDFPGDQADAVFSDVAEAVYLHFAQLAAQPQTASSIPADVQQLAQAEAAKIPAKASEPPPAPEWPPLDPGRVDLSHLPETGAALFGRDDTLTFLDQAWSSQGSDTRVLAFKAQGGVGKSTLINHWLAEMRRDHFRGATRVFGWSFYSQGVREQGAPSADAFVAAALTFFGDETMAASAASPWDKGQRLARLVGAERALLVLDGMEPLQSAQPVDRGKLRDPALEALLRGLAKQSAGLCLITTREPLADLGKKSGIVECDLEQITPQAGRALLRALHVVGTDAELESLAARFGPHALAISLLGVYLHEQPGRRIGPATALEQMPGKTPVDRVLAGFEKWLGPSAELEALRLLGFFDRPADEGCLQALRASAGHSRPDGVAGRHGRRRLASSAGPSGQAPAHSRSPRRYGETVRGHPSHHPRTLRRATAREKSRRLARGAPAALRTPLRDHEGRRPAHARRPPAALPSRGPRLPGGVAAGGVRRRFTSPAFARGNEVYSAQKTRRVWF